MPKASCLSQTVERMLTRFDGLVPKGPASMRMHTAGSSRRRAAVHCGSETRVFIVDDDHIVRETISAILTTSGYRVSKYSDAAGFLAGIGPDDRGCLLVDIHMPGMNGIQLIDYLVRAQSPFAMLVISGHADVPLAVQAIKAGALDIIEKPFSKAVLLDQIGKATYAPFVLDQSRGRIHSLSSIRTLSVREHQVLELTVAGYSSKEIARQLGGSPRTVETHRANIMKKLGVKRLSALVNLGAAFLQS